jgi:N-acetylmuramoyl-L-alanine amidase
MAKGEEIYNLAIKHQGERYHLGSVVPKDNSRWSGPWDCAEFVSWCVYQVSEILYGCDNDSGDPGSADAYTGYWGNDARKKGKIISVKEAANIKGAAVLRLSNSSQKVGHIVISDGKGGTIEAHSTNRGVIKNTLSGRRWDMGILVPGIDYESTGEIEPDAVAQEVYRLTKPMMKGDKIREIQETLLNKGFNPGEIDGKFGNHTYAAVVAFQSNEGLVVDGEVGPATLKALGL